MLAETLFWTLVGFILYTYAGYPILVAVAAYLWGRAPSQIDRVTPSLSVVLPVYNEGPRLARRLKELTELVARAGLSAEVIVVSDGATDDTAGVVRPFANGIVRLIELPINVGKAAALTRGCQAARNEILVFADARQTWAVDALQALLRPFADAEVAAVSGDLVLESGLGVVHGVGLYWKYEKWLRRKESDLHSMVGVTGAICAVRRAAFRPIPTGTLLDDVYWPLQVNLLGYRVVHQSSAVAFDRLPTLAIDEFRRKIRTLTGNFQLLALLPAAFLPWRNPVWIQFVSHKLFRLLIPWSLLGLLALSLVLSGPLYSAALAAQVAFYSVALVGFSKVVGSRFRSAAAASSFVVLNAAAWLAFWNWVLRRATRSWAKVAYQLVDPSHMAGSRRSATATECPTASATR